MSVGPRRRTSPLGDMLGRVGRIAGETVGGGVIPEQRRQTSTRVGDGGAGGLSGANSITSHTSESQWSSDPLPLTTGTPSRLVILMVRATGLAPGTVGHLAIGDALLATAPTNSSGSWAQTVPWPAASSGSVVVTVVWVSPESGTLTSTLIDPG